VGKAFGFDRALDTAGAVAGPILALWLVGFASYRQIFLLSVIPGLLAAISFAWIVRAPSAPTVERRSFRMSLKQLPPEFRRFLIAVGVFGVGDFAHTLLILRASQILSQSDLSGGSHAAVVLYVIHNIVYASASYPVGALGDRIGRKTLLAVGYALSGAMCLGFVVSSSSVVLLVILFSVGGFYIAIEDSLERAVAADLLPPSLRGTGFGVLASLNGIGDLISSSIVGLLWSTVSPQSGFLFAAVFSFGGALLMRFGTVRRSTVAI
jgi:MFS family permease